MAIFGATKMKILNDDSDPSVSVLVIDENELWHLRQAMEQWCNFLDQYQDEGRAKRKLRLNARAGAELLLRDLERRRNLLIYTLAR
jgi:hypothetical protein